MSDFFNWNDNVTADSSEFITLMPGKYFGKVSKIDKKRWEGNGKMNGCPYAEVTIEAKDADGRAAYIKDNLFLARSVEWKIGQFLHAFGLKKKDEPVRVDAIMKALGKTCVVTVECQGDKSTNYMTLEAKTAQQFLDEGRTVFNKIKAYESDEAPTSSASSDNEFGF